MSEIILHHYPISPFAEKIRAIFGFKGIEWRSVIIPMLLPKPDLLCLTGGYRRTPVMQIGNDVYCDTQLIARVLEERWPEPALFPAGEDFSAETLGLWADSAFFQCAMAVAQQPEGIVRIFDGWSDEQIAAFRADRARMREGATLHRPPLAEARTQLGIYLRRIELQLADGRDFLFGYEASIVDFSVYHPVWFLLRGFPDALKGFANIDRWFVRMTEFGNGRAMDMSPAEAIEVAKRTAPSTLDRRFHQEGREFASGDKVEVVPTDYAFDPTVGEIVMFDANEVAIYRRDERAGEVLVHFPRQGFVIRKLEG